MKGNSYSSTVAPYPRPLPDGAALTGRMTLMLNGPEHGVTVNIAGFDKGDGGINFHTEYDKAVGTGADGHIVFEARYSDGLNFGELGFTYEVGGEYPAYNVFDYHSYIASIPTGIDNYAALVAMLG